VPGMPGDIKTIPAAKAYALSKSVPEAAIDKLIELGKRLGWEDKKIIDNILNLAKMKTGAATPNPVPTPENPNGQPGMPKMQKAPDISEFSPAIQAAIKRCAERTNMPMGFILGLTKQMMKANRSEKDVIKLLDSMKMSAPKDKNNGGGSPFGK